MKFIQRVEMGTALGEIERKRVAWMKRKRNPGK